MKRRLPWLLPVLLLLFLSWSWYTGTLAVQPRQLDNGAAWRSVACWFEVPAGKRVECGRVMTRDRTNRGRHSLPVVIIRNSWLRNDPSPVVFIQGGPGGAAGLDALTMAYRAVQEGASGVDMGRNIFQSDSPIAMLQAVAAVVHRNEKPDKALDLYQTLKNQS